MLKEVDLAIAITGIDTKKLRAVFTLSEKLSGKHKKRMTLYYSKAVLKSNPVFVAQMEIVFQLDTARRTH